jgi:hypothetical protein
MSNILKTNDQLTVNQKLVSPNGSFELILPTDGNLVLYSQRTGKAVWASNTWNTPTRVTHVIMQTDGNLVAYDAAGKAYWSSNTWNHPGATAVLENDGSLVVLDSNGVGLWASDLCLPNVRWQNWPENLPPLTPAFTCVPQSVDDIAAIVQRAEGAGKKVHARGSGWSFSAVAETTDFQIVTSQLNREIQTVQKALVPGATNGNRDQILTCAARAGGSRAGSQVTRTPFDAVACDHRRGAHPQNARPGLPRGANGALNRSAAR